jgi:hypothetical protein
VYYGLDFPFSKLSKAKKVSGTRTTTEKCPEFHSSKEKYFMFFIQLKVSKLVWKPSAEIWYGIVYDPFNK